MSTRPLEKDEERAIISAAQQLGFHVYKTSQPQPAVGMTKGLPDLYLSHPKLELRLWWEVKREGNTPTEHQSRFAKRIQEAGGTCEWGTFDDFLEWCEARGLYEAAE